MEVDFIAFKTIITLSFNFIVFNQKNYLSILLINYNKVL